MKILSKERAVELLSAVALDDMVAQLSATLPLVEGTYSSPLMSGVQIALSKLLSYLLLGKSPIYLFVTNWGVATEQFDLFDRYRRSFGDQRPLIEAPVHLFERADDEAFVSTLCMVFFFSWDASIFDAASSVLFRTSHDGWLEFRTSDEKLFNDFAVEVRKYAVFLRVGKFHMQET